MRRKKSSLINPLLGGAAIVVALYTILFGSVQSFTTGDAEHMLFELSGHLSEEASERSKEAKLQYSNVEIEGFAYDKIARIGNISLDLIYQQWQGGKRFGISTEEMLMTPDHTNPNRLIMKLPKNINIISSSELLAIMMPAQPLTYLVNLQPDPDTNTIRHTLHIPNNFTLKTLQPQRTIYVKIKHPTEIDLVFSKVQHQMRAHLISGAMEALFPESSWSIKNSDVRFESVERSAGVVESKGTLTLDQFRFSYGNIASEPHIATAAWTMKEQRNISGATDSAQLTIEHGLLSSGDSKIAINGILNFDIDDVMYGELMMEISNPYALLKSSWIVESQRDKAQQLLQQVLGEDELDTSKQILIPISRQKNGDWMIGKMSLQQLKAERLMELFIFGKEYL